MSVCLPGVISHRRYDNVDYRGFWRKSVEIFFLQLIAWGSERRVLLGMELSHPRIKKHSRVWAEWAVPLRYIPSQVLPGLEGLISHLTTVPSRPQNSSTAKTKRGGLLSAFALAQALKKATKREGVNGFGVGVEGDHNLHEIAVRQGGLLRDGKLLTIKVRACVSASLSPRLHGDDDAAPQWACLCFGPGAASALGDVAWPSPWLQGNRRYY